MNGEERTIVQLVLVNETGDSYYRMRWPGAELAKQNPNWRIINLDAQAKERFEWGLNADLLVLLQSSDLDLLWLINERHKLGKKTLIEYNDNFYQPQLWSPVVDAWNSPIIWQSYELIMKAGDTTMVTGPGLMELFTPIIPGKVVEIENNFPRPLPEFKLIWSEPTERIRLGWAGSLGHMADIISVREVIANILEEFPQVDFYAMGNESLPEVLALPKERFFYTPWGSMDDYIRFWGPVHIGIAPLLDTPYNNCRSDIKAVEMASSAAVPVLSSALPYKNFIKKTGAPSFDSPRKLHSILQKLIKNTSELRKIAEKTYNYVRNERIGPNRKVRSDLYTSLMGDAPSSNYRYSLPLGYHEVMGTSQPEPPSRTGILLVQQLLNQKRKDDAMKHMLHMTEIHSSHPELHLAKFKLMLGQNRQEALLTLPELRDKFPRDLRFPIIALMGETDQSKFDEGLLQVLSELERIESKNRTVFLADILNAINRANKRFSLSVEQLLAVSKIYPGSPEILLLYAQSLAKAGRVIEAAELYRSLRQDLNNSMKFDEFRKQIGPGFLAAWEDGLKGQ